MKQLLILIFIVFLLCFCLKSKWIGSSSFSDDEITNWSLEDIKKLKADDIKQIEPEQISLLKPNQITFLKGEHLNALRIEQIREFSPEQISSINPLIIHYVKPNIIQELSADQIIALEPGHSKRLNKFQLIAISRKLNRLSDTDKISVIKKNKVLTKLIVSTYPKSSFSHFYLTYTNLDNRDEQPTDLILCKATIDLKDQQGGDLGDSYKATPDSRD